MPYDPQRHHRRSIRLPGYDYTQPGAYFITLVTHDRMPLFGEIVGGEMRLNEYGKIVRAEWFRTAIVRPYVVLYPNEFVVMPNHVHGIIWIVNADNVGATRRVAPTTRPHGPDSGSIGAIIGQFKSVTTKRINACAIRQAHLYGNVIITNTLSATMRPWPESAPTSNPIPNVGPRIGKTRSET